MWASADCKFKLNWKLLPSFLLCSHQLSLCVKDENVMNEINGFTLSFPTRLQATELLGDENEMKMIVNI